MPSLLRATVLLGAGALVATSVATTSTVTAAPAAGTSVTRIQPADLPEGPAPAFAHVEGTTVVDGAVRVPVDARQVTLLGESGPDYVVMTVGSEGRRVVRLSPDGSERVLVANARSLNVNLSRDGEDLLTSRLRASGRTDVRVLDATDASVVASRRFRGLLTALDFDEQRVIFSSWGPQRTFWWNTRSDLTQLIVARAGGTARITANRVSTYTKDPYEGGCTTVRTLRRPGKVLWRSCKERVDQFSPDGRSMATIDLLSDGIGPREVLVRSVGGRKLAHYATTWFGRLQWESPTALVLDANGQSQRALVRCVRAACERVSPLTPTPQV